jgi:hexokinase
MTAKTSKELFSFLAKQIEDFLKTHHDDHYQAHIERRKTASAKGEELTTKEIFHLGFTFSFPVNQIGINKGTLARWTKGFDISDAIGKDVCELLQTEIDALHLPVKVAALVNDTVGTLMARSYGSPGKTGTLIGGIFGTGTNGAYVEKLDKITKLASIHGSEYDKSTGEMIVNTEWGSFDNQMSVLPNTPYDDALDKESINPGIQMFEKRVSGMFLGEILRRAILALHDNPKSQLFKDEASGTSTVAETSPLFQKWGIDTSILSTIQADTSPNLSTTLSTLSHCFAITNPTPTSATAIKHLVTAIGKRAARLSALAIASVIISTGNNIPKNKNKNPAPNSANSSSEDIIDVGVDGSLVEFYPGFEGYMREAFREIEGIGREGEGRVRIGIAKDGSGVGAALIALVAAGREV